MASKSEINKSLKRLSIVQAAEEIFKNKPYSDITMDEIAVSAKITKKTVYSYFPSKLSLFITIFERCLEQLHDRMFKVIDKKLPIEETVKSLFNTLFEFTRENEKLMRLFWALESDESGGEIPAELISRINIWNKALLDEMIHLLEKGVVDNTFNKYDPAMIVHMFSAMNKGVFIHTNKEKRFNIAEIDAKDLFNLFTEIVLKQVVGSKRSK